MTDIVQYTNLEKKVEDKFLQLIRSEQYPIEIKEGITDVLEIIKEEKSITDLYPELLAEIPISQSQFQDQCVQYEQHFTYHKKLRQAIMEMNDRLEALYAAKTNQKKSLIKVERLKYEIEDLENVLITDTENKFVKFDIAEKEIELEEAQRGLRNASHLIKDAMLKVVHQRSLVERYQKIVEESGLSYEESEFVYYVMYFTAEAERQLRTGDHQIDRGTFGAISQTPEPIRKKILSNINFLRKKLFEDNYPMDGDFLFKIYEDILKPKFTAPGEVEGMSIKDFYSVNTIKLISKGDSCINMEQNL